MVEVTLIDHGSSTSATDDWEFLNDSADNSNNPSRTNATPTSDESGGFYQVMNTDVTPHGDQTNISSELDDDFLQQCIDEIWGPSGVPQDPQYFPAIDATPAIDTTNPTTDLAWLDCYDFPDVPTIAFSTLETLNMGPTVTLDVDPRQAGVSEHRAQHERVAITKQGSAPITTTQDWLTIDAIDQGGECTGPLPLGVRPPCMNQDRLLSDYRTSAAAGNSRKRRSSGLNREEAPTSSIPGTTTFQLALPAMSTGQPLLKSGRVLTAKSKENAKRVRRSGGACLRCQIQKIPCDDQKVCSSCIQAAGKARYYEPDCVRMDLQEATVFRAGNSKFKQDIAAIRPYPDWQPGTAAFPIRLIRPHASSEKWPRGEHSPKLEIQVRRSVPSGSDITAERWRSFKGEMILDLPCVAAVDNKSTTDALISWVDDNFDHYARDMTSQGGDFVISATFREAIRFARKRPESMVRTSLRIWIGARMAQEFFALEENNFLGVSAVQDADSIHNGNCPLPPVLDHQVDVLMIHAMLQMKNNILQEMKTIIVKRKLDQWYEVYLTVFVLLATLQYVYIKQERWWRMHNLTGVNNSIGSAYKSISYRFMETYKISAANLISHFRYSLKGPVPFTLDWDNVRDKKDLKYLDSDAIKYVKVDLCGYPQSR